MPVYEYECNECQKVFEVQQKMADAPLRECPECTGEVKKLISSTSFQLKGGGWYADGYASTNGKSSDSKSTSDKAPACASGGGCAGCPATAS